jgi:aconitase B
MKPPTQQRSLDGDLHAKAENVYRYMNFDRIAEFSDVADTVTV